MTLRTDLLPTVDEARALVSDLGLRPWTALVRRRTWDGGSIGAGTAMDVDTAISPTPKALWPKEGQLPKQGRWEDGDVVLSKVSRQLSEDWLLGRGLAAGEEHLIVLVHGDTGEERMFRPIGATLANWERKLMLLQVGPLLTWKAKGARTFTAGTGGVSYAETTTMIRAQFGALSIKEQEKSGVKVGDVRVLVLAGDLATAPKPEDRFVFDDMNYGVYAVEQSQRQTFFITYGRRS